MIVTRHWPHDPPPPQARGNKNAATGQDIEQFITGRGSETFIDITVYFYTDLTGIHQFRFSK
ncbi:hypothetical protein RINTU1_15930 [Candidatus Regiella insecticola]|uniref:Uncharacterized protein n=1 Tax=Candidatus Regiella insecticola TaxID=138073 RepID=A0A6L2ZPG3_9ENTR|nr:hypothetical protein RINTU1_15930 [Candidatus Regiella insecticola]